MSSEYHKDLLFAASQGFDVQPASSSGNGVYLQSLPDRESSGPIPAVTLAERLPQAPSDFILSCLAQGEYGDAQLLAFLYSGRLVYDHAGKRWYEWALHFWKPDKTARVRRIIAGQLATQYLVLAAELGRDVQAAQEKAATEETQDEPITFVAPKKKGASKEVEDLENTIDLLKRRGNQLRALKKVNTILDFAGSFMGIEGHEWDHIPGLLACSNGVVNLKTGQLSHGRPTDYIKSVCQTEWIGLDAPAPRWDRFLQEVLRDESEVIDFLQEIFGFAITGTVLHHILVVLYGPRGRNGKDTLLETIGFVLGHSIASACAETVFVGKEGPSHPGGTRDDLYQLMGKRLVWGSESSERARLNSTTVKKVTGGGTIVCRPPYGRQVTFQPTHTALLLTNYEPQAPAGDDALWERVKLIGFLRRFVENPQGDDERPQDPDLKSKLQDEASGVLAWMARGAMRWYERGRLLTPESVKLATREYRDRQNEIADFLEACCWMEGECPNTDIWSKYQSWAEENKLPKNERLGRKGLSQALMALDGVERDRTSARKWRGISLKDRVVI